MAGDLEKLCQDFAFFRLGKGFEVFDDVFGHRGHDVILGRFWYQPQSGFTLMLSFPPKRRTSA